MTSLLPVRAGYHDLKDFVQSLERPRRVSCARAAPNAFALWAAPASDGSLNAQFQLPHAVSYVGLGLATAARTKFALLSSIDRLICCLPPP